MIPGVALLFLRSFRERERGRELKLYMWLLSRGSRGFKDLYQENVGFAWWGGSAMVIAREFELVGGFVGLVGVAQSWRATLLVLVILELWISASNTNSMFWI